MVKVPSYAEVEEWHLIDKIKVAEWLEEMFKRTREKNVQNNEIKS